MKQAVVVPAETGRSVPALGLVNVIGSSTPSELSPVPQSIKAFTTPAAEAVTSTQAS